MASTWHLASKNLSQSILAATEENPKVRVCAEHLKQYSEGLNLCNTIRMRDALNFLTEYQEEEKKKKKSPDAELVIKTTETEQFLFDLFEGIVVTFCFNTLILYVLEHFKTVFNHSSY